MVDRPTVTAQTSKRPGEEFDAPSPRRARADSQAARSAGDNEFRERHRLVSWDRAGAFTANEGDLQGAILFPVLG